MSILEFPRIHFHGGFSTNVDTANNNNAVDCIDAINVELTGPLAKMTSTDEARAWLQDFVESPIEKQKDVRAGWNYWGDHTTNLESAAVSGVCTEAGGVNTSDPIVGAAATLSSTAGTPPVMVDIDPTGTQGTQIFAGGFQLGTGSLGMSCSENLVMYSRWITGPRNLSAAGFTAAQATWQFAIAKQDLTWAGVEQSPALKALQEAANAGLGVIVQYTTYFVSPKITSKQLYDEFFSKGKWSENPAIGLSVGTVGVWSEHDWQTVPNGRLLNGVPAKFPAQAGAFPLGPATVRHDRSTQTLSLNFAATVPEVTDSGDAPNATALDLNAGRVPGVDSNSKLEKADLGTLTLAVRDSGGTVHALADLTSVVASYDGYLACAGIYDVTYADASLADVIDSGDLLVQGGSDPKATVLQEQTIRAETDGRAVYLEPGQSGSFDILVRERGAAPSAAIPLTLTETASGPTNPTPGGISFPSSVTAPAGCLDPVNVTVTGNAATLSLLNFAAGSEVPGYTNLRVLPTPTYDVSDEDLDFEYVYQKVLRFYDYLFPRMSQLIPLSSRDAIKGAGPVILKRLKETDFNDPRFMPVTRSMGSTHVALIERWLRKVSPPGTFPVEA